MESNYVLISTHELAARAIKLENGETLSFGLGAPCKSNGYMPSKLFGIVCFDLFQSNDKTFYISAWGGNVPYVTNTESEIFEAVSDICDTHNDSYHVWVEKKRDYLEDNKYKEYLIVANGLNEESTPPITQTLQVNVNACVEVEVDENATIFQIAEATRLKILQNYAERMDAAEIDKVVTLN